MADFKKPWADWTPEIADAVRAKLEARAFNSQEETLDALRALEGYWAEHDMERTLEKNAPFFSAKGAKRFARYYFPKTLEAYDAKRPWWMTAMQVPRDVVTSPQRAGIYTAGSLANAGIWGANTFLGTDFKPIDPETYDMSGTSAVQSDPSVALLAHPAGTPMKFVGALSAKGAETAGKFAASKLPAWAAKGAKAAGGFGGEVFGVSAIHNVSNLGEFTPKESAQMAVFGTGLSRGLGVVPKALGKGMQESAKYLTRQKYNISPGVAKKSDLHGRTFDGVPVRSDELIMLESGDLGRDANVAEAITGKDSKWAKNIHNAYQKFSADQNARVEDALALRPQVSVGEKLPANMEGVQTIGKKAPSSRPLSFEDQATAFRRELEAAGVKPSEMIVREGETTQQALAREMNEVDSYLAKADAEIDRILKQIEKEPPNSPRRAALEERGAALAEMRDEIAGHLERAGELAEKMGLGIVARERYSRALAEELASQVEGTGAYSKSVLSESGERQALKAGEKLIDDIEADIRRMGWNKGTGSGRFMPMDDFRAQMEIVSGEARNKTRNLPYLETANTNAMRGLSSVRSSIDNAQTLGDLRESGAGRSASMRYAFRNGLEQGEGRFNNANRMNAKGLYGLVQRRPIFDKTMQSIYNVGGKLVPRDAEQLAARRALLLDQSKGGELGDALRAILAFGGRESSVIRTDYGRESPTQKAWDSIENFIASVEAVKQGEAK